MGDYVQTHCDAEMYAIDDLLCLLRVSIEMAAHLVLFSIEKATIAMEICSKLMIFPAKTVHQFRCRASFVRGTTSATCRFHI